jgi:hypothetical protein
MHDSGGALTLREPGYLFTVAQADEHPSAELVLAACVRQNVRERSVLLHRAAARLTA